MATEKQRSSNNISLTQSEIVRLENALKDPEFRDLLVEYSKEVSAPENRRLYEKEFLQLERELHGKTDLPVFLHPRPGYVIKVRNKREKVFVNVCSDMAIGEVNQRRGVDAVSGKSGIHWSVPHSVAGPRRDVDKSGKACEVYDVIFHPGTLELVANNPPLATLVNDTALGAVEKAGNFTVDRTKVSFPKMKFKGVFHPTVIRKDPEVKVEETKLPNEYPLPDSKVPKESEIKVEETKLPKENPLPACKVPRYTLKYQHKSDMETAAISQVRISLYLIIKSIFLFTLINQ